MVPTPALTHLPPIIPAPLVDRPHPPESRTPFQYQEQGLMDGCHAICLYNIFNVVLDMTMRS